MVGRSWLIRLAILFSLAAANLQGEIYSQTLQGTVRTDDVELLNVEAAGSLWLRGAPVEGITYQIRLQVQAATPQGAERLFRAAALSVNNSRRRLSLSQRKLSLIQSRTASKVIISQLFLEVPNHFQSVRAASIAGDLEFYDVQGNVGARSEGGRIQMDRIRGSVTARTGGGGIYLGTVGGTVRCLSDGGSIQAEQMTGESWLETSGGDIHIRQASGPVHASTEGGNIEVGTASDTVNARTAGGQIQIQRAGSFVTATNSSGSIQVGSAKGVRCESNGGTIRLRDVSGELTAVSSGGSIVAQLAAQPIQNSELSTISGDITVFIPSNIALGVRAHSDPGQQILSEFPQISIRSQNGTPSLGLEASGMLNGGGPMLRLIAGGGTIYLRRQP